MSIPEALRRSKLARNFGEQTGRDALTLIQIITRSRRAGSLDDCCHPPSPTPRSVMNDRVIPFKDRVLGLSLGAVLVAATGTALAQAKVGSKPLQGEVVKMVRIDALSGLMGGVGNNQLKSWQFFAEKFSASNPAGVKFE